MTSMCEYCSCIAQVDTSECNSHVKCMGMKANDYYNNIERYTTNIQFLKLNKFTNFVVLNQPIEICYIYCTDIIERNSSALPEVINNYSVN